MSEESFRADVIECLEELKFYLKKNSAPSKPPVVMVNTPPQERSPAPIVNVEVPKQAAPNVSVTVPKPKKIVFDVEYDTQGKIKQIVAELK